MRVCNPTFPSILLVVLTATVSESRSPWRRPTPSTTGTLLTPFTKVSSFPATVVIAQAPLALILRGGDDGDVPTVPEATTNVHARGGSTTTKKPSTSTTTTPTPTPGLSISATKSVHTGGALPPSTTTTATASTTTTATTAKKASPLPKTSNVTSSSKLGNSHNSTLKSTDNHDHKPFKKIAKKLRNRNARNLRRKVMHASFGFCFAAMNHFIPKAKFVPGMTILTSATLVMELLRYRKGFHWMNDILHLVLGQSLRKHEMDGKFTGSFYYFLGVTVTAALYPTSCATLGICQLAIADPTASFFGRATRHVYWSRIENGLGGLGRNKGILGFIGGAVCCLPLNYRILSHAQFAVLPTTKALWTASLALGFAGAFADLAVPTPTLTLPKKIFGVRVPPFHMDDNFVVPIFSGFACTKIFAAYHFPADLALAKFLVLV